MGYSGSLWWFDWIWHTYILQCLEVWLIFLIQFHSAGAHHIIKLKTQKSSNYWNSWNLMKLDWTLFVGALLAQTMSSTCEGSGPSQQGELGGLPVLREPVWSAMVSGDHYLLWGDEALPRSLELRMVWPRRSTWVQYAQHIPQDSILKDMSPDFFTKYIIDLLRTRL